MVNLQGDDERLTEILSRPALGEFRQGL
jgi:hypothetical protein